MKATTSNATATIERHPWEPFAPANAKILFLGSFPPPRTRWSMDFYYPNITNDFWRIMGIIFFDEKEYFIDKAAKKFKEEQIKTLLTQKGIALYDAATAVRRLSGNASDAHLQIVEATDVAALLAQMPHCHTIAVTGEKAAEAVLAPHAGVPPKIGESTTLHYCNRTVNLWRLPSTSRAYPLATEKKAQYYRTLFTATGIL